MVSARMRTVRRRVGIVVGSGALALLPILAGAGTAAADPSASGGNDSVHTMAKVCPEGKLCVWDKANGQGHRADFYYCQWEDVTRHGLARVGSFVNNQTDGTVSTFYGMNPDQSGSPWVKQYTSKAFEIHGTDQGAKTYGIQVC